MMLTVSAYAADEQYHGGSGSGSAMAESAGCRLNDMRGQGKGSQYSGGSGSGSAFGEYVGRLDGGKGQSQTLKAGKANKKSSHK